MSARDQAAASRSRRRCRLGAGVVLVVSGACAACGSAAGVPSGDEPPGLIGFVGGVGPGIGFVGGRPPRDAGRYPDAAGGPDAGNDGGSRGSDDAGLDGEGTRTDATLPTDAGDEETDDGGSTVGIMLNLPPGFFESLTWTIAGPSGPYSGTIAFGAAQSIEFVVGGIEAGSGYTITLTGVDPSGDPCRGTSAPFTVSPGATAVAGVTIECFVGDGAALPATITTGSVAVEAGVVTP